MKLSFQKIGFCILLMILGACAEKEEQEEIVFDEVFFNNFFNQNILPSILNLQAAIETEQEYIEDFLVDHSAENFEKTQKQWVICAKQFSKVNIYNYIQIRRAFLDVKIYNFPSASENIEDFLMDHSTLYDDDFFANKSTVSKGLGAIEYLLFHDQDTQSALSLLVNHPKRMELLLALCQNTLAQVEQLKIYWEEEYKNEFVNSHGASCSLDAKCISLNQIINILDVTKVTKLGKPAGLEQSDHLMLEQLEAYRSMSSLSLIRSAIEEIEHVYFLSSTNFSQVIRPIDDTGQISDAVENQITKVYHKIDVMETSLYHAITQEPEKVLELHTALSELTQIFSVDITALLSISNLPTDNDGD